MRRAGMLTAILVLAWLPGSAVAAKPNAGDALRKLGLRVTWPVTGSRVVLAPGAKLAVTVSQVDGAERPRAARLTFLELSPSGAALRSIASRTLRRGTFRVTLPQAAGAHYALELTVGDVRRRSLIDTPAPPPAAPVPVAALAPDPPPAPAPAACTPGAAATMTVAPSYALPGDTVRATFRNVGCELLQSNAAPELYRLNETDGNWVPTGTGMAYVAAILDIAPGQELVDAFPLLAIGDGGVFPVWTPGRYRLMRTAGTDELHPRIAVAGAGFEVGPRPGEPVLQP